LAIDLYKILVEEGRTKSKNNIKLGKYKKVKKNEGNCICSSKSEFTKDKD